MDNQFARLFWIINESMDRKIGTKAMRKKTLIFILLMTTVPILIAVALPAAFYLQFSYVTTWRYCAEFDDFAEEFQTVADYVLLESAGATGYYDVTRTKNGEKTLYDPENKCYLDLPAQVRAALERIDSKEAFPSKGSYLDLVYFYEKRVDFKQEGGSYKLVYSPDGKPAYWHSPDDGKTILVKSIGNGWYHVVLR